MMSRARHDSERLTANSVLLSKRSLSSIVILLLVILLLEGIGRLKAYSQVLKHDVRVINVEVPVRVFKGNKFVDNLGVNDFEIREDGIVQDITASYLVKDGGIERKEGTSPVQPIINRSFYIFFVLYEFDPKIREAVEHFVTYALRADDQLTIFTPRTKYEVRTDARELANKKRVADKITKMIKRDILIGESAYRSALKNLKRMAGGRIKPIEDQGTDPYEFGEGGFASAEEYLMQYRADLEQLESARFLDQDKIFEFANAIKKKQGQKVIFLIYQREFTPMLDKQVQQMWENSPTLKPLMDELFSLYSRTAQIDEVRLKKAFLESSLTAHFLYLTTLPNDIARSQMEERSWDIYELFAEVSKATGGISASSSNLAMLMQEAQDASKNYYLLHYSAKNPAPDGTFRSIEVKVKNSNYRILHRAGYFSD
jgi:hypothetical protein